LRLGKIYTGKRANEQQGRRSEGIAEKMTFRKHDPVVRKHVEFKEAKIK
jgi:ribosomal protein L33